MIFVIMSLPSSIANLYHVIVSCKRPIAQFFSPFFVILSYSETELEDLLTTYTKLNKNGNVFLGGNHPERSSEESTNKAPSHDPGLSRRKETKRHSWR